MIHNVELPEITLKRLTEVVHVQMALLSYAVSESTENSSQTRCAEFLSNMGFDTTKPGRSFKIAKWIWNAEGRYKKLIGFAAGPTDEKRTIIERLSREAQLLLSKDAPKGSVNTFKPPKDTWQKKGADFLCRFYDELSAAKLPEYLFSDPNASDFRRQNFLKEFLANNQALHVCPICDESGSYTSSNDNGDVHTDIEHYFPQSLYPHFACHPYNLIPICHLCNSAIHGDKDPLQPDKNDPRRRFQLQDIVLPYRGLSLGTVTRLDVKLDNVAQSATFTKLISTDKQNTYKTQIATLDKVYEIPGRWNEHHEIDKVGETLFRRMRQFLRGTYELPVGDSLQDVLFDALHQLLYFLHYKGEEGHRGGDYGKDPFAFAMTWLLVAILKEEKEYSQELNMKKEQEEELRFTLPLLEELARWLGQDINSKNDYTELAERLISMVDIERG